MWKTQKWYPFCGETNNFVLLFCIIVSEIDYMNYNLEWFFENIKT